jgi:hypothetical protein
MLHDKMVYDFWLKTDLYMDNVASSHSGNHKSDIKASSCISTEVQYCTKSNWDMLNPYTHNFLLLFYFNIIKELKKYHPRDKHQFSSPMH